MKWNRVKPTGYDYPVGLIFNIRLIVFALYYGKSLFLPVFQRLPKANVNELAHIKHCNSSGMRSSIPPVA